MIRLKQLLGIILLAIVTTTAAAGSTSQLAGIRVEHQDNDSFVTISANGAFTHTEYRPTDSLMLVDLAGVSIAHPDATVHSITSPGVQSYRIVGYRSANGMEVARIELNLAKGATVKVNDVESGVELRISGGSASAVARPVAEKVVKTPAENVAPAVAPHEGARMSHINNIAIARGKDGINVEVTGSEPMTAKTMKLTGPDRVVLDIPNSVLEGRSREIPVNSSDVKDVRAARFQSAPPATRIVVDMAAMRDFEVVPSANKLVLKFKGSEPAHKTSPNLPLVEPASPRTREASLQPSPAPPATADKTAAASGRSASVQPQSGQTQVQGKPMTNAQPPTQGLGPAQAQDKASNVVIVNPVFSPKESASAETQASGETQSKADRAASRFANPAPAVVASNRPAVVPGSAALAAQPAVVNAALQQQQQQPPAATGAASQLSSGCTTGRYTGEPVSMDLKDVDLKDFFRFIKEISGLNVIVDPSVHGTVTIDISDIPWDQALALVLRNSSLECELQGNVLRIAALDTLRAESESRKAQQDAQALQVPMQNFTWYLSYAHAKDVVPVIKKFLSARGSVVPDERSNGLIIEDIPQTLPKVQSLLKELDRKTPEVEIEARVVAATRTFARDIGTQLGFGWGNGATSAVGGATTAGTSPITITPTPGVVPAFITAGTNSIPLFSNLAAIAPTSGLSFTNFTSNYRLDFVLTMAESRGLVKILSRPRVVTQNNLLALVKQGTRIPVVTQAQLGGPPTVQYIDAFLRLQVTPQITADNTIFLQVDVENTVPDFSRVTGTQLNPSLITQQATTNVLVTDGGTVVIGGVIQTQNSVAINQVPLLGNIPILGNLFKHQIVNTSTQELIFFISPKIVQT
ncbi:MAG TPA: type IV pilus secretin PilQ [Candidatus Solibacter sp.]|jgi:type IV pilus secretin PilQ/predicted competence protein|nr:type IV pilus secretin PilQ [Candidatus Solibacter sp.]